MHPSSLLPDEDDSFSNRVIGDSVRLLGISQLDERLERYRLSQPKLEQQMLKSLRDYGQLSPVVVCQLDGSPVLVDGFKRIRAARTLRIKMAAEDLDSLVRDATQSGMSPWELLERFLALPAGHSIELAIARRIKNAGLPTTANLEAFDWEFNAKTINKASMLELASGEFIKRRDNLAIVGQSGLGKSHLIQGIARACCALGYRVRYETSATLLEELMRAAGAKSLPLALRYYRSFDLLVIDEFGFDKLERREYPESPSLMYKVVDGRNGRGSTAFFGVCLLLKADTLVPGQGEE